MSSSGKSSSGVVRGDQQVLIRPGLVREMVEVMENRERLRGSSARQYSLLDSSTSDREEEEEGRDRSRDLELEYVALDLMQYVPADRASEIIDQFNRLSPQKTGPSVDVPSTPERCSDNREDVSVAASTVCSTPVPFSPDRSPKKERLGLDEVKPGILRKFPCFFVKRKWALLAGGAFLAALIAAGFFGDEDQ